MARMIPSVLPDGAPDSERSVFREAEHSLPDDWFVIHGLYLSTRNAKGSQEGEADFVVFDPARGVLVLEVKGGGVKKTHEGWFSVGREGREHPIKNPAVQASGAAHKIRQFLERHPKLGRAARNVKVKSGVVLPDVPADPYSGIDLHPNLVIDRNDLLDDFFRQALDRVFDHHGMRGPGLAPADVKAMLNALAPKWNAVPTLSSRFSDEGMRLVELTEEQTRLLETLDAHNRAAIEGAAGTGKTLIAVEKARRLARNGQRVLLLCYNKFLAEDLRDSVKESGIVARHFHGYCHQQIQRAKLPWKPPKRNKKKQDDFWAKESAMLLLEALEKLPEERYDAIVVDEGQDFKRDWWVAIDLALRASSDGTLYVFYDPHQNIYDGGPPAREIEVNPTRLALNCRNTRRIAEYAANLIDTEYDLSPDAPNGVEVQTVLYRTSEEMADNVRKRLHDLTNQQRIAPKRITILSTHKPQRSALAKYYSKMGNLTLAPLDSAHGPNQVRLTSLHSFKGLESDVVFLVDVDPRKSNSNPSHLYVAATRARHLLVVMERQPS